MQTCCESCLPKQTMFTLEDVEHIIKYILDMTLPDALAKVRKAQAAQAVHENMRNHFALSHVGAKGIEPCWDCKGMIPELLNMNK
jgi:hypothetical protein